MERVLIATIAGKSWWIPTGPSSCITARMLSSLALQVRTSWVQSLAEATLTERLSDSLHRELQRFNARRLMPTVPNDDVDEDARFEDELSHRRRERAFLNSERVEASREAARAPREAGRFVAWFEELERQGPGQHHPLFDWLATQATRAQMIAFLRQEIGGEAGFEDLVALTQVKLPTIPKLELARNYWDEMGRGHAHGMHGAMLEHLGTELEVQTEHQSPIIWESRALGNLMIALAMNRDYAYHSIGALGVIELTAPGRAAKVNAGLRRLGIDGETRRYFVLHATLDVKHSESWNREVLRTLVAEDAALAQPIAEGALMRLRAGQRCFDRYRAMFNC